MHTTDQQLSHPQTFHDIIERTLMTPSDPPNATSGGPSPAVDLQRNSILQKRTKNKTFIVP